MWAQPNCDFSRLSRPSACIEFGGHSVFFVAVYSAKTAQNEGSDERQQKRFQSVRNMLNTLFPGNPQGHLACRLNTLAAMIGGIVGSRSVCLPAIASKVPGGGGVRGAKVESRIKRFERWLRNKTVESEIFFLPFAKALLQSLCHRALVLAIDGSIVGRGCMTLMVSVVYKQRALPVAWIVAKRRKGHFPDTSHMIASHGIRRGQTWCAS